MPARARDIIKLIEKDGWQKVAQRGSHRQYKHAHKPGRVTVSGNPAWKSPSARCITCSNKQA